VSSGRVDGKVVLISGGARGQGASHARLLAGEGAKVMIGDVLDTEGEEVAARLAKEGLDIVYTHLDVTRAADWQAAVAQVEDRFGGLDVVVNNAGVGSFEGVEELGEEEWARVIAVNQTGVFLGIKHTAPALRRRGGGSVVNTSSTMALTATAKSFAYHASKAAIRHMTRSAALALAPHIRVNCIVPGLVETDFLAGIDQAVLDARVATYPLQRVGRPDEISQAVLFLASDDSSYITGSDIVLDGGALAGFAGYKPASPPEDTV
jgi:NAD(P)-dependent dehydrogenase (short-subunit alcohol dehydrogenase family)